MYERVKDSTDSMMMAIVFEVGECTSLTIISCLSAVQASTPSGSQPLSLRARHLPLPQGTAFIMCPRRERGIINSGGWAGTLSIATKQKRHIAVTKSKILFLPRNEGRRRVLL